MIGGRSSDKVVLGLCMFRLLNNTYRARSIFHVSCLDSHESNLILSKYNISHETIRLWEEPRTALIFKELSFEPLFSPFANGP